MDPVALHFDNVGKAYGGRAALARFSLEVRTGESFGLIGVNGAGKTTLLRCLLDFAAPSAGSIRIFGVPATETAARRALAFLPERFTPPYYLTGGDFLRYMRELHGSPYGADAVAATCAALELDPSTLELPVRQFSKGTTQKLGIAACLLSGKQLQVLDEPASGLDPRARARFKGEMNRLRALGCTLFITSHLLVDIEQLCDRMAVLHAGTLRYVGTPAGLIERFCARDMEAAFLACIEAPPLAAG